MAFQNWSVVAGEVPTTSKWNIIGSDLAGFNDGTAIGTSAITPEKLLASTGTSWVWTDYSSTSTITGWSSFTDKVIRYIQVGKTVFVVYGLAGTSNSASVSFTVPVASKNLGSGLTSETSTGLVINNGAIDTSSGRTYIDASISANLISIQRLAGVSNWTASGTKATRGVHVYETP